MPFNPRRSLTILAILACLSLNARSEDAPPPLTIDPANPPAGVFIDEWYAIMINGQKCGQMRTRMERLRDNGKDLIFSQTKMQMRVRRDATEISIGVHQKTTETLDGEPVAFSRIMHLGRNPMITEGTVRDGKVTITTNQFGQQLPAQTYDLPKGAMMDWGLFREQFRRGLKPGTKYDLPVYEPTLSANQACRAEVEIIAPETIDLFGRKVEAVKARQTMHMPSKVAGPGKQETVTWVTDQGQVLRLEMSMMGIPFEIISCPKAVAMADDNPAELLVNLAVQLNRGIDENRAKSVTYEISSKNPGDEFPHLPETAAQKVVRHTKQAATLKVTRLSARAGSKPAATLSEADRKTYLAASPVLNYRDPEVAKLAKQAAGKAKDPRELAEKLCNFVHGYIFNKSLGVGFASASEVARSREGDCTEHGVLLAALGRACGIPSRVATGLVYADTFGGQQNVMAGHLWTQFWIDGEWVDVDAAFGQTDVAPIRITLALSDCSDTGFADLVTATWMSLGKLTVKVVDVQTR